MSVCSQECSSKNEEGPLNLADSRKAELHEKNSIMLTPNGEYFSLWGASTSDFGIGGIGIELYFVFLKQMILLFFLISLVEIPTLILICTGNQIMDVEKTGIMDYTTLANLKTIPGYPISISDAQAMLNESYDSKTAIVYVDVASSALFIVLVVVYILYNERRILQVSESVCSPSKYAIEVTGVSGMDLKEEELKDHFENYFGPVVECVFARDMYNLLPEFENISQMEADLKKEEILCQRDSDRTRLNIANKRKELAEEEARVIAKMPKDTKDGFNISRAYLIFESLGDKKRCMTEIGETCCSDRITEASMFRGRQLIVRQPCEPSDLQWENLDVSQCQRVLKDTIALSLATVILVGAFAAIYATSYYQSQLPESTSCGLNSPDELEQMANSNSSSDVYCFCASTYNVIYIHIYF